MAGRGLEEVWRLLKAAERLSVPKHRLSESGLGGSGRLCPGSGRAPFTPITAPAATNISPTQPVSLVSISALRQPQNFVYSS
jgi:hypothetical protein